MKLKALELGPFLSNCYILGCETTGEGLIIDAGAEAGQILKAVEELELEIKLIVATHGHIDHVGAVKEVKEATGAQFAIHKDDVETLSQGGSFLSMLFRVSAPPPPQPDILLQGGDSIKVGELSFLVLHTPGHSPGGICLLGHGVVFTGDTLFCQSIGRFDLPGASGFQLLNSIHTKLMVLPDHTVVYPGHGPQTTIGDERRWNPFLKPGVVL